MTTEAEHRPVVLWFRHDLRLADNPALIHAIATGRPVLPVFILDPGHEMGAASLWWLDKSLRALDASLRALGSRLILRRGDGEAELRRLINESGAGAVFMNRRFEPDAFARDADIAHALEAEGVTCKGWNGTLLARPGSVLNGSGLPYKVFTPFHRALLATAVAPARIAAPDRLTPPPGAGLRRHRHLGAASEPARLVRWLRLDSRRSGGRGGSGGLPVTRAEILQRRP